MAAFRGTFGTPGLLIYLLGYTFTQLGAFFVAVLPEGQVTRDVSSESDHVVWMPTNSAGAPVRSALGVDSGAVVGLRKAILEVADATVTTEDGVA